MSKGERKFGEDSEAGVCHAISDVRWIYAGLRGLPERDPPDGHEHLGVVGYPPARCSWGEPEQRDHDDGTCGSHNKTRDAERPDRLSRPNAKDESGQQGTENPCDD